MLVGNNLFLIIILLYFFLCFDHEQMKLSLTFSLLSSSWTFCAYLRRMIYTDMYKSIQNYVYFFGPVPKFI